MTGARPVEVLNIKAENIVKEDNYVIIHFQKGYKYGRPRKIYLRYYDSLVKELYYFAANFPDEAFIFFNFKGRYKLKNGTITESDKLRYHFKKWFKNVRDGSITPYFLRHNRFSQLSEAGATMQEIKYFKGAKSLNSVDPYVHLSTIKAKKMAKKIK